MIEAVQSETGRSDFCYNLDSERVNFKLFSLVYWLYLLKFELFGARLLKKRDSLKLKI